MSRFLRLYGTKAEYDAAVRTIDEPSVAYVGDVDKVFYRKERDIGRLIREDNDAFVMDSGSEIEISV
jgi:hypothetical protein